MTQRPPDPSRDGDFVHLHVHSEFSLLDGLSRIGEMTQRVADQGMPARALTDHRSIECVIRFYRTQLPRIGSGSQTDRQRHGDH